jgi:hypothetical protein
MAKKKPAKKKVPPKMSKGAQTLANTLMGNSTTIAPPMGMPANGPMQMGMMGPDMMRGYTSEPGTPAPKKKRVMKRGKKK